MTFDAIPNQVGLRPMTAGNGTVGDVSSEGLLNYFQGASTRIGRPQSIHHIAGKKSASSHYRLFQQKNRRQSAAAFGGITASVGTCMTGPNQTGRFKKRLSSEPFVFSESTIRRTPPNFAADSTQDSTTPLMPNAINALLPLKRTMQANPHRNAI